jgi:rubredoxin
MASDRFICLLCGYTYDPARGDPKGGIKPGTPGEALPPEWRCPNCGADQRQFARRDDD